MGIQVPTFYLLGVRPSSNWITDLNTFANGITFGMFTAETSKTYTSIESDGFIVVYKWNGDYMIQLIFFYQAAQVDLRTKWGNSWSLIQLN